MISAWQVYLVLQLDAINVGLGVLCGIVGALVFAMLMDSALRLGFGNETDYYTNSTEKSEKAWKKTKPWLFGLSFLLLLLIFVKMLLPSSKTMAAMIILPAITSHEVVDPVAREAGELYKLAKDALKKAVNDDEPTTAETK